MESQREDSKEGAQAEAANDEADLASERRTLVNDKMVMNGYNDYPQG